MITYEVKVTRRINRTESASVILDSETKLTKAEIFAEADKALTDENDAILWYGDPVPDRMDYEIVKGEEDIFSGH